MAKLGFTKLGLKQNTSITNVSFNDNIVEVKQYLPIEEKLEAIANIIENSHDQNNFSNPLKVQVYTALELIENYTNINLTEKQKENPTKLYDLLKSTGLLVKIIEAIPSEEYKDFIESLEKTIESIYTYQNSALGILENAVQDYNSLDLDASEIQKKLADPENMELLKSIMTKLG